MPRKSKDFQLETVGWGAVLLCHIIHKEGSRLTSFISYNMQSWSAGQQDEKVRSEFVAVRCQNFAHSVSMGPANETWQRRIGPA